MNLTADNFEADIYKMSSHIELTVVLLNEINYYLFV